MAALSPAARTVQVELGELTHGGADILAGNLIDAVAEIDEALLCHGTHGGHADFYAGYAAVNRWGASAAAPALLVIGYAVGSLGNLFTSVSWAIAAALAFQAVRGLGLAAQDAAAATMIQRAIPRALQGRAADIRRRIA